MFVVAALLIKPKQEHGKIKNTGLFINCMDFVVVATQKTSFFVCLGLVINKPKHKPREVFFIYEKKIHCLTFNCSFFFIIIYKSQERI
jgi:hypothetical protein